MTGIRILLDQGEEIATGDYGGHWGVMWKRPSQYRSQTGVGQPLNWATSSPSHEIADVLITRSCLTVHALKHDMSKMPLQPLAHDFDSDPGFDPTVLRLRFPEREGNVSTDLLVQ